VERAGVQKEEKAFKEEKMKGNRSSQPKRGQWKKDRSERGIFRRGKVWYIRFSGGGKVRVEAVGPSKALAIKVCAKRRTEVAERRFFPGANISFDELIKDAIAEARRNHEMKRSQKKFRSYRYRIVGEWFKGREAAAITPGEIDKKLAEHCRSAANFNRYRVALSHTYKIAMQNGKAAKNPASLVTLKKENNERVRFLETDEETALRRAIRRLCPRREAEFDLALYTGMRWSEQFGLRWAEVDLKRNKITLLMTKGGKTQHVRLNAAAHNALARLRAIAADSEFVCPDQDEWTHRQWWDAVRKVANVSDFHWHDLRHTFASRLVMSGVDIYTVNKLMRHETLQVTKRYAHLADAHLQRAVERLRGVTRTVTARESAPPHVPATIQ
jgi:site-specific recombinase XerD